VWVTLFCLMVEDGWKTRARGRIWDPDELVEVEVGGTAHFEVCNVLSLSWMDEFSLNIHRIIVGFNVYLSA
jgi:hypothetical protein